MEGWGSGKRTGNLGREQMAALEGVDGAQGFQGALVVADQRVHAQQANQGEVAHHAQHVGALVVALSGVEVLLASCTRALKTREKFISMITLLPCWVGRTPASRSC